MNSTNPTTVEEKIKILSDLVHSSNLSSTVKQALLSELQELRRQKDGEPTPDITEANVILPGGEVVRISRQKKEDFEKLYFKEWDINTPFLLSPKFLVLQISILSIGIKSPVLDMDIMNLGGEKIDFLFYQVVHFFQNKESPYIFKIIPEEKKIRKLIG